MLQVVKKTQASREVDFVSFLKDRLLEKMRAKSSYSMRAFARDLNIDPSLFSKILRGERKLTSRTFFQISEKLSLTPELVRHFAIEMGFKTIPNEIAPTENYWAIPKDAFEVISNWYYFAIFELLGVEGVWTTTKIAKALEIPYIEASLALDRLARMKMIKKEKNVWLKFQTSITTTQYPGSTPGLRQMQRQILDKAKDAMEKTPIEKREQSSLTMAIDASLLPLAKKKIAKFRRELHDFLQSTQKTNEVYNLSLSFYPVTSLSQKGKK